MKTAQYEVPRISKEPQTRAVISTAMNADSQSIVVNAPVPEVYRRLLRFEDLPQIITSITKIDKKNDTQFSSTSIINGEEVKSDVQIMMRVPDRRIAWQAASDHFRVGVVFFDPIADGATKVTVKIRSNVEPVTLTGALRDCLRNLKRFVEDNVAKK